MRWLRRRQPRYSGRVTLVAGQRATIVNVGEPIPIPTNGDYAGARMIPAMVIDRGEIIPIEHEVVINWSVEWNTPIT
jgi:hypothetical protein